MNFTAIDFETANRERSSACQIGLVVVENGTVINEFSSFIRPTITDYFLKEFTDNIHGITYEMVKDAPTFYELWSDISDIIENSPLLVAHNSSFDMGVLNSLITINGIETRIPEAYCTYKSARTLLPNLKNYKLSTLCSYFSIPLNHHEALSDARAAAKIAINFMS